MDKRKALIVALLFYVNLLNYMDRSTVAGMISFIKDDEDFDISLDGQELPARYRPRGNVYSLEFRTPEDCLLENVGPDMT